VGGPGRVTWENYQGQERKKDVRTWLEEIRDLESLAGLGGIGGEKKEDLKT